MKFVVVSGAGGQLGKAFVQLLAFPEGYSVFGFDRGQLDITNPERVKALLQSLPRVRYWINCGAYTKVDDAERDPDTAFLHNADAAGWLAEACREAGVHLVHFSSDYVYDNGLRRPLLESDPTTPRGVYALSKLAGEERIRQAGGSHTILRTSWVYGPGGHNFVRTMLRLGASRNAVNVVGDQAGAPTFTYDIVRAVRQLIDRHAGGDKEAIRGTFNFANAGVVTWADFARTIFRKRDLPCEVHTITTEAYGAAAPRPAYSVLDCQKITGLLDGPIPSWENALDRFLALPEID